MSADNEICILELTDAQGHKEYRVANNVSMSYNTLGLEIDLTDKEQVAIVYNIWNESKEFYHSKDAHDYANNLEENGYYEYGIAFWKIDADWETIVKLKEKDSCIPCGGSGELECFQNAWGEHGSACPDCNGTGFRR